MYHVQKPEKFDPGRPVPGSGAGAALFHRADPPDRQHAAAHAHPRVPVRADLRLAVRRRGGLHRAADALGAVRDAAPVPHRHRHGL